jgi:hypothetical protein
MIIDISIRAMHQITHLIIPLWTAVEYKIFRQNVQKVNFQLIILKKITFCDNTDIYVQLLYQKKVKQMFQILVM